MDVDELLEFIQDALNDGVEDDELDIEDIDSDSEGLIVSSNGKTFKITIAEC